MSAVMAMEYAAERKPFIARDVRPENNGRRMAHMAGTREEGRLSVGCWFSWDDREVKVTSFAENSSYLVACAYRDGYYDNLPTCEACGQRRYDLHVSKANKPEHVYKITAEDLRAGRAAYRKKYPKCKLCLKPAPEGKEVCEREHRCQKYGCHKPIPSTAEGRRVSMGDGQPKWLLCNICADAHEDGL